MLYDIFDLNKGFSHSDNILFNLGLCHFHTKCTDDFTAIATQVFAP